MQNQVSTTTQSTCADAASLEAKYISHNTTVNDARGGCTEITENSGAIQHELNPLFCVAIYFEEPRDRERALFTAQRQKLTLNAFLAAAVRMVLTHNVVLTQFARPNLPDQRSEIDGNEI